MRLLLRPDSLHSRGRRFARRAAPAIHLPRGAASRCPRLSRRVRPLLLPSSVVFRLRLLLSLLPRRLVLLHLLLVHLLLVLVLLLLLRRRQL